jgi:SAM-dependent methyltransferase
MTDTCDFEPLEALARFSWQHAPSLCDPAHGCLDYHRPWSLVRLLELDGALPSGYPFFAESLAPLAVLGTPRVGISGGADTGVTAMAVMALRHAGCDPRIVFVDRCATPCRQNERFARSAGFEVETLCTDVTQIACEPADAVVVHTFLHFLSAEGRRGALQAWLHALRPGGKVIMQTPAVLDESDWIRTKDMSNIAARCDKLAAKASALGLSPTEAEEFASVAGRFLARIPGQPPAVTPDNVRDLFEQGGFVLQSFEVLPMAGRRGPSALATQETSPRFHVRVVAIRP